MRPVVSIIIRTFNEEDWIWHTLKAIEEQTFNKFEVIIVDNFSTDNTIKIAKNFKFVKKILKIKKFIPGKALNYGCSKSRGKFLVFLSAHCIPADNKWLRNILISFNSKKIVAVYGKQSPIKYSQAENIRDLYITFGDEKRVQKKDHFFHNANSAIRKSTWKKIPFSNSLTNIEDRHWSKQIIDKKYWIVYQPKANVFHHHGIHHGTSKERLQSTIKVIEKIETKNFLKLPDTFQPQNVKILIVINFSNYKNNKFYQNILCKLLDEVSKLKINKKIFFFKPANFKGIISNKKIKVFKTNKKQDLASILQVAVNKNIKKNFFPDYVLYLNGDYLFRPNNIINQLIKEICNNGYDALIPVFKHYNTNFIKRDHEQDYIIFGKNLTNRNKKVPSFLSYYGIGTLVKSKIAQKGLLSSSLNNGLFQLKRKLHTIRLSEIQEINIKRYLN